MMPMQDQVTDPTHPPGGTPPTPVDPVTAYLQTYGKGGGSNAGPVPPVGSDPVASYLQKYGKGSTGNIDLRQASDDTRVAPSKPSTGTPLVGLGAAESGLQGLLGGFADEIGGAGNAVINTVMHPTTASTNQFKSDYESYRDVGRGLDKGYAQDHPIAHGVAELTGAALPALASGGALSGEEGAGMLARMGKGALSGAATSAVYGAGNAQGGIANRAAGAATAAIPGAVLGALGPVVTGSIGGIRSLLQGTGADNRAVGMLSQALQRDQVTPDVLAQRGADAAQSNAPMMAADLGGKNTAGVVRWATSQPSTFKDEMVTALENRNAGQFDRIVQGTNQATGNPYPNVTAARDALEGTRSANAAVNYPAAYAQGPYGGPVLDQAMQSPAFAKALGIGQKLADQDDIVQALKSGTGNASAPVQDIANAPRSFPTANGLSRFAPVMYRETNIDRAVPFLDPSAMTDLHYQDVHLADQPHLALGQGANQGVKFELATDGLQGLPNTSKPGLAFSGQVGNGQEFIGRSNPQSAYINAVRAVTISPDAQFSSPALAQRLKNVILPRLESQGWTKTALEDGSVRYTPPVSSASPSSATAIDRLSPQITSDPGMMAFLQQKGLLPANNASPSTSGVSIKALNFAKQYLDQGISKGFDANGGFDHTTATVTRDLLGQVLADADKQVPAYAAARGAYAADSKPLNALDLGQQALRMAPDELTQATASMTPQERQGLVGGAMDALKNKGATVADKSDLSAQFLSNPAMRQRLQAITPTPQGFDQLMNLRDQEQSMARTLKAAVGGSDTERNRILSGSMDAITPSDIAIAPISPHRTIIRMLGRAGQRYQAAQNTNTAEALSPYLQAEPGTESFSDLIQRLTNVPKRNAKQTTFGLTLSSLLASGAGQHANQNSQTP